MAFVAGQVLTATQLNALDINSLTVDTDTLVVSASNDRVGVNRSSPVFPLHAYGSTVDSIVGVESGDAGAYIAFIDSDSTGNVYDRRIGATGDDLKFQTGATDRMTIKDDGDVGIGTTSPGRILEVAANVPALRLTDLNNSGVYHEILGDGSSLSIEADDNNQGSSSSINFKVDGSQKATITSDGRLGIATTSPAHPLDVVGEARFSTSVQFNNGDQVIRTWGSGAIDNLLPGSTFGGILEGNSTGHFVIGIRDNDANDSFSVISGGGDQTTNGYDTLVAYFGANGEVGIGTSSPSASLHVNAGATNNVATFESTDAGAIISLRDNSTTGNSYVGLRADGDILKLRAGNSNHIQIESGGDVKIKTGNIEFEGSGKTVTADDPQTGTGNDAEWAAPFGTYILQRNSSLAAEKENVTADLGTHLTADMIDSVVPKMWNRIHAPGHPEIGPIAEEMDAISPFLAAHGTTAEGEQFLTGINKTAYLSLLVLALQDARARLTALEAG